MFLFLLTLAKSKNLALIFAGSNEWNNYRHQADAWAIYQELIKRQFDKNNIRLVCYDDIAYHPQNNFQGKIFHDLDHKTNIYGGSELINYKNKITKSTFKEALFDLNGNEDDNLFIYYVDHGAVGFISVPDSEEGHLTAPYIADVMIELHQKKSYRNCIFFMLACLSGSVGEYVEEKLIKSNIKNTAIITSAGNNESSMGSYYDPWNDITISSQFSISFIDKIREDPDCTISNLFDSLVLNTKYSTPVYYGDENLKLMKISDFIGTSTSVEKKYILRPNPITDELFEQLHYEKSINKAKDLNERKIIKSEHEKEMNKTNNLINTLNKIALKLNSATKTKKITNQENEFKVTDDYFEILEHFSKSYGIIETKDHKKFSAYLLKLSKLASKEKVIESIDEILKNK